MAQQSGALVAGFVFHKVAYNPGDPRPTFWPLQAPPCTQCIYIQKLIYTPGIKISKLGLERWLSSLEHLLSFERTCLGLVPSTWWLTTI